MEDKALVRRTKIESALLKAMSSRDTFDAYKDTINQKTLFPATKEMLDSYTNYFELYNDHLYVNFESLYTHIASTCKDEDDLLYIRDDYIPSIEKVSIEDAEKSLVGLLQHQTIEQITYSADNGFDIEKIQSILDEYKDKQNSITDDGEKNYTTLCTANYDVLDKSKGIPHFLPSIQESLGSMTLGQFIVVTADTNGGKSAYTVSQSERTFNFLVETNDKRPILYFNSEGADSDVCARFFSKFLKDKYHGGYEEVLLNIEEAKIEFAERYDDSLFKVFQMQGCNIAYVKREVIKHKPCLLIVDMCDELASEESPMLLKKLYGGLRSIANNYCPVMGTSQAGDTSYWERQDDGSSKEVMKKWLTIKDVYGCKQKAGSADTLIGIGVEPGSSVRYISIPKKKRGTSIKLHVELQDIYSSFKEMF